jgi:pyrroline-5-carboxylate reductase
MLKDLPEALLQKRILLVGSGRMGTALLNGWRKAGFSSDRFMVNEPNPTEGLIVDIQNLNPSDETLLASPPDIVVLAVKPQYAEDALPPLVPFLTPNTLIVSLLAGQSLENISALLGNHPVIIRTMPNTPAAIGLAMTALIAAPDVSADHRDDAMHLMQAVGQAVWLDDEKQMDAVTAISGSGPAYLFHMAEAMTSAGVNLGLSAELSLQLATQTIVGAAGMMAQEGAEPAKLRRDVTSPSGTTEAALDVLMAEQGGLTNIVRRATQAAAQSSREMSKLKKQD